MAICGQSYSEFLSQSNWISVLISPKKELKVSDVVKYYVVMMNRDEHHPKLYALLIQ